MANPLAPYLATKDVFVNLVTKENQLTIVPACPDWTVRDLLAHQVGCLRDVLTGNLDGLGTPPWTATQIAQFHGASVDEIKWAWDETLGKAGEDALADAAGSLLPDIVIHEQDLRGALGVRGNRDSLALAETVAFMAGSRNDVFREQSVPALRISAGSMTIGIGEGQPEGELRTSVFEASRALSGRRSVKQMHQLDWSTDPSPWVNRLSVFPSREDDLVE
ncbi:MAG TPA: hypothetical protein VNZ58_14510 [Thermomicrobiales bacterium]|nr:hypothetical protein [Thermomicrobiales bacterium]